MDWILGHVAKTERNARKSELKGDGKAGRWFSPLAVHVLPKLGTRPVSQIHQSDIRDCLAPIWHEKADVAKKAMNRLGRVQRYATAKGHDVDLQATAKAKELLGESRFVAGHIASMAWQDVPGFCRTLDELTVTHLALHLLILTAPKTLAHLLKLRFVVMMTRVRSQSLLSRWKSSAPPDALKGK